MVTKVTPQELPEGSYIALPFWHVIALLGSLVIVLGGWFIDSVIFSKNNALYELETAHRALSQRLNGIARDGDDLERINISQDVEISNLKEWRDEHMRMMYEAVKNSEVWKAGIDKDIETMKEHIKTDRPYYR